jgi:hypothetical protein
MDGLFCNYSTGMLADQPLDETQGAWVMHLSEMDAAAYHEAGHAVVYYALGLGVEKIGMRTRIICDHENNKSTVYGGKCYATKTWNERLNRALRAGRYSWEIVAMGIGLAAGTAAERKCSLFNQHALRSLHAAEDDRWLIDYAASRLIQDGRNPDAFRHLIWRQAQVILEDPVIWQAVDELAMNLEWPHDEEVGDHEEILDGPTARRWIREVGVRPGMLVPKRHKRARGHSR